MMGTFGQPEFDESTVMTGGEAGPGDSAPEIEIDPNDPFLTSAAESMETDAAHDAYAMRPPMPDGKWRAKVRRAPINKSGTKDVVEEGYTVNIAKWLPVQANGKPVMYFAMNLELEIIDPTGHYDGFKLTEFHVKTLVNQKAGGASPLATIIRKSGGVVPEKTSQKGVIDIALAHFAGEPELILESQWVATCQHCEEEAKKKHEKAPRPIKRAQRSFGLKAGAGNAFVKQDPLAECPTCHTTNRAKPVPLQYFTVKEAQPTFVNRR